MAPRLDLRMSGRDISADALFTLAWANGGWEGRAEHILRLFGEEVGRQHLEDLKTVAADQGHIIVRVAPGGDAFHVVVLTDADESLRVRSVHGPYASR